MRNLASGRIGRALIAIRDQPIAAESMGVNAALYKTACFGVSALYAGVAGGLSALAVGFVSPDSFGLSLSLSFLVGIVVGGLASLGGVLFGALFIEFVPNLADQLSVSFGESAKALPGAIYGVLLILVMALMPTGVAGALRSAARMAERGRAAVRAARLTAVGGPKPPRSKAKEDRQCSLDVHSCNRAQPPRPSRRAPARPAPTRLASPTRRSRSARPCPTAARRRPTA